MTKLKRSSELISILLTVSFYTQFYRENVYPQPKFYHKCTCPTNREYLNITCRTPHRYYYRFVAYPPSWSRFKALTHDKNLLIEVYLKYFVTRPFQLINGGHRALIKYSEKQLADENGFVDPNTGRHILSDVSSTFGGDPRRTEMIFLWDSEIYEKISVVPTGGYLQIVKVMATFLLAAERVVAVYLRVKNPS